MRIWLVTIGEPLPTDSGDNRLYRVGTLAEALVAQGHEVLWWSSSFDHRRKEHRCAADRALAVGERYRILLIRSLGYRRNVSLRRIADHAYLALRFARLAAREEEPDLILCSLPPLELCLASVGYGRRRGIPVLLDVRDLWPDVFLEAFPRWGRPLGSLLLAPFHLMARSCCRGATAILGLTPQYVGWGVRRAGRGQGELDLTFPLGYLDREPPGGLVAKALEFWESRGVRRESGEFVICFFGSIGRLFRLDTVIEAARMLERRGIPARFVICGSGDHLERYREQAAGLGNVTFPGWVGRAEIWALMRIAKAGLVPYRSVENFRKNIPNKPIEYLSAGLPILSCLDGVLRELIEEHRCGVMFSGDDPEDLCGAVVRLAGDGELLRRMSENAGSLFRERFVADQVYAGMIRHLEGIVARGRAAGQGSPG